MTQWISNQYESDTLTTAYPMEPAPKTEAQPSKTDSPQNQKIRDAAKKIFIVIGIAIPVGILGTVALILSPALLAVAVQIAKIALAMAAFALLLISIGLLCDTCNPQKAKRFNSRFNDPA